MSMICQNEGTRADLALTIAIDAHVETVKASRGHNSGSPAGGSSSQLTLDPARNYKPQRLPASP